MAESKVALVTGGTRGLGLELSSFLAGQDYSRVIDGRDLEALDAARQKLVASGATVVAIGGDVSEAAHRTELVTATGDLGGLDLLVNNASFLGPSPMPTLADYPPSELSEVFEVNVIAPVALSQEALPLLRGRQGLIVNISSDAALGGYEGWGGYGASKAALDLVSLTMANELRGSGVSVVSVDPGDMRTQMHQDAFPGEDISDRPLPEVTLPFWAWLLNQDRRAISGQRFQAQAERWAVAA
ncbi:MAG TPA: SDR family oxidoreductase [Dehalococcoidia bacterium]|nr:SDR family oxidoreductase [Dehalococcoidia bacterium]